MKITGSSVQKLDERFGSKLRDDTVCIFFWDIHLVVLH